MPFYDFKCQTCGCKFEVKRSFSQGLDGVVCPACRAAEVQRIFSPVAAYSKGSSGASSALAGGHSCSGGCASCSSGGCSCGSCN